MKVTKKDIVQAFGIIIAIQPNFLDYNDTERAELLKNIWYEFFKEVDSQVFMEAVKQATLKCKYNILPAYIQEEIDMIINGNFNAEQIWNENLPLMVEMLNNNQDDIEWYRDNNGLECKHKYFNAWEKLEPTLKATFVRPSAVVDLMRASDFEFNSFKNRYCKDAINLEKEFRKSPELKELVKKQRKPIELDTLKQSIVELSYEEKNLLKG